MEICSACSMPLDNEGFVSLRKDGYVFCIYCVNENKEIKSCEDIFEGGIQYFINEEHFTRDYAEKVVRKNMYILPYWQNNPAACLEGDMLTDEEFQNLFKTS
ncbi:hypothetical protein DM558_13525 [Entomomonas moraniae]|uniref:Putative zinc ribbon domain-containing protein n=1 Tax=Entomomonas moraniae TaxID=2213226 RepID=A0A3Q9JKI4_9GAMM|nr:zinc ribbon domain-containing protein [Entomomonas moraniae]AZS51724.1 hypothetical protein DM558_13525 [Entomomonas moraniae]